MTDWQVRSLEQMPYRQAWEVQEAVHAQVASGESGPTILVVEHPAVITFGRRAELSASHLVASADYLQQMGVEVVESDRGGDITFHGLGQVVVYPIVRLVDFKLSVGAYVRRLQDGVIAALTRFGVEGKTDPEAIGVWVETRQGQLEKGEKSRLAKICAVGVRVKGGTTLHGVALNVSTDLKYFELIVPCGLAGRPVTSLAEVLSVRCEPVPSFDEVGRVLAEELEKAISRRD